MSGLDVLGTAYRIAVDGDVPVLRVAINSFGYGTPGYEIVPDGTINPYNGKLGVATSGKLAQHK